MRQGEVDAVGRGEDRAPNVLAHMLAENQSNRTSKCPMGRAPNDLEIKSNLVGLLAGVGNGARLIALTIERLSRFPEHQVRPYDN